MRMKQVLANLISNSIKFTDAGKITLGLDVEEAESASLLLHFSLTDTGIGVPGEFAAGIFEPFTQAASATSRKYGGTGLGLSICNELVKLMGGSIWMENGSERGSCFHFTVTVRLPAGNDRAAGTGVATEAA